MHPNVREDLEILPYNKDEAPALMPGAIARGDIIVGERGGHQKSLKSSSLSSRGIISSGFLGGESFGICLVGFGLV